nr:hypothetical protein Iba_chr07fCG10050 [Ipomoea batatas]
MVMVKAREAMNPRTFLVTFACLSRCLLLDSCRPRQTCDSSIVLNPTVSLASTKNLPPPPPDICYYHIKATEDFTSKMVRLSAMCL